MNKEEYKEETLDPVEHAVGELYRQLFRLEKAGKYDESYVAMGTIINMLTQDRMRLLTSKKVKIDV